LHIIGGQPFIIRSKIDRALHLSEKYGMSQLHYNIIYLKAWIEFYWFENPNETFECYQQLKKMLDEEINCLSLSRFWQSTEIKI